MRVMGVDPGLTRRIFAVSRSGRADDPLIEAMIDSLRTAADELLIPDAVPTDPVVRVRAA